MCDQNRLSDPSETEDPENIPRTKLPQIFQPGIVRQSMRCVEKEGSLSSIPIHFKVSRTASQTIGHFHWSYMADANQTPFRFQKIRNSVQTYSQPNPTYTYTYTSLRSNPCLWSLVELKGRRCDAHIGTRWQPCGNSTHHLVSARKKIPWLEHRAKLEISINNLCATWYYTTISLNILDLTHLFIGIQGLPQFDWIRSKVSKNDVCKCCDVHYYRHVCLYVYNMWRMYFLGVISFYAHWYVFGQPTLLLVSTTSTSSTTTMATTTNHHYNCNHGYSYKTATTTNN